MKSYVQNLIDSRLEYIEMIIKEVEDSIENTKSFLQKEEGKLKELQQEAEALRRAN